jgi:UDP-N-acetylmuramyl tripeptide synthase
MPDALTRLSSGRRVVLVSGTNGKTTTTSMIAAALGGDVCTNITGANLPSGLVSALASNRAATAVLEVDELHLPEAIRRTQPSVVVLLNLTRDQLDRMHDPARVAASWTRALRETPTAVVASADDPLVVAAARDAESVTWVAGATEWQDDIGACDRCGRPLEVVAGTWRCQCGNAAPLARVRPTHDGVAIDDAHYPVDLALPGRANGVNAAFAVAVASTFGVPPRQALDRLATITEVEGRYARFTLGGRNARLLLAKNPAGWRSALDVVDPAAAVVIAVNARTVDGVDTSWLWDVPFETLAGRSVGVQGDRSADVLLRLQYAGVAASELQDLNDVAGDPGTGVEVLGNYTAFADIRQRYVSRR